MIKAVIFDIGGVLLDDPQYLSFWKEYAESNKLREQFGTGKISREAFIEKGSKLLDMSQERFLKEYSDAYSGMQENTLVIDIYDHIKVPKNIFSDSNPIHYDFCKAKFPELFNHASKIFLSFEIGFRKNNKQAYEYLLSKLPYAPNELIFIDNNIEYIRNANSFGIYSVLYTNGISLKKELLAIDHTLLD